MRGIDGKINRLLFGLTGFTKNCSIGGFEKAIMVDKDGIFDRKWIWVCFNMKNELKKLKKR